MGSSPIRVGFFLQTNVLFHTFYDQFTLLHTHYLFYRICSVTRSTFFTYISVCRCLLRVLDTFGTEPVFNYKKWKPEKDSRGHDYGHTWGNWELNPRQFMTMYRKRLTGDTACS